MMKKLTALLTALFLLLSATALADEVIHIGIIPVSYTHLTLPTKLEV